MTSEFSVAQTFIRALSRCFKTACRTDAAKSTGCVVTPVQRAAGGSSTLLAAGGHERSRTTEHVSCPSERWVWRTLFIRTRPLRFPRSGERSPRCWFPELGASRWPRLPEWKRLRRGQRPRWTGIGRHVGLRKESLSARHPSGGWIWGPNTFLKQLLSHRGHRDH